MTSRGRKMTLRWPKKNYTLFFWNQHKILNKKNVGDKNQHEIATELHKTIHYWGESLQVYRNCMLHGVTTLV